MADQEVGGVSVRFTAEAEQLQQQIQSLEQRLRAFDRQFGNHRIRMQAELVMPGQRTLADFRRGIEQSFNAGSGGRVKARVELLPPTAAQLKAFREKVGDIKVDVVGNFKWGNKPPKTVEVEVVERGGGGAAGNRGTITQALPATRAATTRPAQRPSTARRRAAVVDRVSWTRADTDRMSTAALKDQLRGSSAADRRFLQGEIQRREREGTPRNAGYSAGGYRIERGDTAGPRGFTGDAYSNAKRNEARQLLRQANQARLSGGDSIMNLAERRALRQGPVRPEDVEQRNADLYRSLGMRPPTGGARGLTGGMIGAFGRGAPAAVPHWSTTGQMPLEIGQVAKAARLGQLTRPATDLYDPGRWVEGQRVQARDKAGNLLWDTDKKTGRVKGPKQAELGPGQVGNINEEQLYQKLKAIVARADPRAIAEGTGWYERAGKLTQSMGSGTGLGRHQIAAATAAFSQNAGWGENVRNAQDFFEALRRGATTLEEVNAEVAKIRGGTVRGALGLEGRTRQALRAANASGPRDIEENVFKTSPKIKAFYRALMGDPNSFTVDRHQAIMMSGHTVANDQRVHDPFQRAGRRLAGEMGISAADLQAISWVTALGHEVGGDDPYAMWRARGQTGGPRGYSGEASSLTWQERMRAMPPKPLQLKSSQPFARGVENAPIEQIPVERLLPYRELDREVSPRMQLRGFHNRDSGEPDPWGPGYLDNLTEQIRREGGIKKPLRLEHDEVGQAQLTDGNHRLAVARRLGLSTVPVQAYPARGLLTGNTAPIAFKGATTAAGIVGHVDQRVGAGGPRGFTGSPFGDPLSRSGSPAGVGWEAGRIDQMLEDRAVRQRPYAEMAARLKSDWGGFTMDPATNRFMEQDPSRKSGPYVSGVGRTLRMPYAAAQDIDQLEAAIQQLKADPYNARLLAEGGHQIGGFYSPDRGEVDLDIARVDQTASAALRTQRARGPDARGAYNVATGNGLFAANNVYGQPETRVAGMGQPRVVNTGRFASQRDVAAAIATPLGGQREGVDRSNLEVPTFLRNQEAERIGQEIAQSMAAEPGLQETLAGVRPGDGRRPPASAVDVAGTPTLNPEAAGPSRRGRQLAGMVEEARVQVAEARGAGQIRSVGTTMASQIGTILGGRGRATVVAAQMTHLIGEMEKVGKAGEGAFRQVEAAEAAWAEGKRTGAAPNRMAALTSQLESARKAAKPTEDALKGMREELAGLAGEAGKFRGAAVGMASSISGTMIGLALFSAASEGVSVVTGEVLKGIDAMQGYQRANEAVFSSLGDLTRQHRGHADLAVADTMATAGLSSTVADSIRPFLEQRAAIDAGNKAFDEQVALVRAARATEWSGAGIPGITTGTGGVLGSPFGATAPLMERVFQQASPAADNEIEGIGRMLGDLMNVGTGPNNIGIGEFIERNNGSDMQLQARISGNSPSDADIAQWETFNDTLINLQAAAERADPAIAALADVIGTDLSDPAFAQARRDTIARMQEAGASTDQIEAARQMGIVVRRPGDLNRAVDQQTFNRYWSSAGRGMGMPNREEAARQSAMQIAAQFQLQRWQGGMQRNTMIPGQTFMRQLAAGRIGTNGQANFGGDLSRGTTALPPELLRGEIGRPGAPGSFMANVDTSQLSAGRSQLATQANAGRDAIRDMVRAADSIRQVQGPRSLLSQFDSLTSAAAETAGTIRSIQQSSNWMQVRLQVAQINEQIFVMGRSLEDAKSFISGTGSGELGLLQNRARGLDIAAQEVSFRQQDLALQGQQLSMQTAALGIRSRELQLMQNQRQINFQMAIAGFVTPGQTPEEIAARQDEARLAADFAQQQQDIGMEALGIDQQQLGLQAEQVALAAQALSIAKEQFSVQQAMIDVQAARTVRDLGAQIGLLQQQAQVTVQLAVNADAVDAYQAILEEQMAQIQSVIEEAYGVQQTVMSNSAALAAQYGGTLTSWNNMIIGALNDYLARAYNSLSSWQRGMQGGTYNPDYNSPTGGGPSRGTLPVASASGYLGSVSGASQMIVGEAGPETVAILRNPRTTTMPGPSGGGGGLPPITIMITGNNIGGDEQDLEQLAALVARKVEETMSRRSSLLGIGGR
jgi:hypothetical protein